MELPAKRMVEKVRQGDTAAAGELIELYYEQIYAFLRRLAGNDADAADLTQTVFGRVWQALPTFQGRSSVNSWMHGIAYHVYVDWRRARRETEPKPDEWWDKRPSSTLLPDDQAERNDQAAILYASVDQLQPEWREAIHLHYYQSLTLDETAAVQGVATSTVKYRLRQALAELQRNLEQHSITQSS